MTALGVAIIGLGVGEQHVRAYHANPNCRVTWLFDINRSRAQSLSESLGFGQVAPDIETILKCPETQIISLATYDDDHADQVVMALEAGKHVFVEKPLCQNIGQLKEIKTAWKSQNGRLKLGCNLILRAAPLYCWLRQSIRQEGLGQVYMFDGEYLYGRLQKITEGWRKNVENYSVIQGGGIHLIDIMLWVTGQRPDIVSAMGNNICSKGTEFHYEDYVTAIMQNRKETIFRITGNFGCVHRHHHVVRIFGTKATFIYDDAGPRLHWTRDQDVSASQVTLAALPTSKGDLIPSFITSITSNEDITDDTQILFDGISISIACNKALKSHSEETIEYV